MIPTIFTAASTFSACTAARWYLHRTRRREACLLDGHVRLTELWNSGAAFGLPASRELVTLGSLAVLAWTFRRRKRSPAAAGLVLGGGLSNLRERLHTGAVYDYLQFPKAPSPLNRYVFNLADLAIILGSCRLASGKPDRRK